MTSEKLYGGYLTSVQNVREAKSELAKQAAQCVERVMLDDDMFLVNGDTVGWKVRIYREEAGMRVEAATKKAHRRQTAYEEE